MRIAIVGGGPAGLYAGILFRRHFPECEVEVFERNRAGDTFGFGVVFSDETLSFLEDADRDSFAELQSRLRSWREIRTWYRGEWTTSTGHGFSALARTALLDVLQNRARELGCGLRFENEVAEVDSLLSSYDLVIAADGVNSRVRERRAAELGARTEEGATRFSWLGTDLELEAFTFVFAETDVGLLMVHAYPFQGGRSTWIVECHEDTWKRAGLDVANEAATVAICERLLAPWLEGRRLLANRSIWRRFPTVTCERWSLENLVLLGDAAHTAHFSIGSGTKLAMEDAIALVQAFRAEGVEDVGRALAAYEATRRLDVAKLQRAAKTSRSWFEEARRWLGQPPVRFTFNLMTRSHALTYDELERRDPQLVARVAADFAESIGAAKTDGSPPPPAFQPMRVRGLELANRIVVSPMCQYSAVDGEPGDWHLVHLGSRAAGGAGLVIAEMTDVSPEGRITLGCTGLYRESHIPAWRRIVDYIHSWTPAKAGLQLAHSGRKGSAAHDFATFTDAPLPRDEAWETLAPSAIPYRAEWPAPRAMERADMDRVREEFVRAARWAVDAGFDWLELHLAHGYLLSSFLSPLSNRRTDDYGGPLANRMRYPLEVVAAVRAAWPAERPLSARISATDWLPDGFTPADAVELARELGRAGVDVIDVSSAGNVADSPVEYGRMYQVPFADRIRHETGLPVMAVGGILDLDHANTVLAAGRADLAVLARAHLADPYLGLHEAARYGVEVPWPPQYQMGRPLARRRG